MGCKLPQFTAEYYIFTAFASSLSLKQLKPQGPREQCFFFFKWDFQYHFRTLCIIKRHAFMTCNVRLFTLFENYPKCRIWIVQFRHFQLILFQLKLTCLVTLFDCKLKVFKNSPFLAFLMNFCPQSIQSSPRSQCRMRLFCDFQTPCFINVKFFEFALK